MTVNEDQAEAPLEPDPAQFDPMAEVCWTLPMAVAWIACQTPDAVREEWDSWRNEFVGRRPVSLVELNERAPENTSAWRGLLRQLLEQKITATGIGINTETPQRTPIPHDEWASLEDQTTGDPDYAPKFRYPYTSRAAGNGYDDILVKSADVQRLWPAGSSKIDSEKGRAPPIPEKMTPGRTPFDEEWRIIKPIALEIYGEFGPYDRSAGVTQLFIAEKILARFREKHPKRRCPSMSWMKYRLREIKSELDKISF